MIQNKPVFTISLDFELYWGVFDKVKLEDKQQYFSNTRKVIPALLDLFEAKQVHVTWATVGMLFAKGWEEWHKYLPKEKPSYANNRLSSYTVENQYKQEQYEPFLFASTLVDLIQATPFQEVATHTFCHYYCKEEGQSITQFKSDLQAAKKIASQKGIALESLVFPRNQYNKSYLRVCLEEGVKSVRSNPRDWFWQDTEGDKLLNKIFRTGDGYLPLGKRNSFPLASLNIEDGLPLSIPASRFLRPISDKKVLNKLRLKRVLNEMTEAAKRAECYHLWWHPHNFGSYPYKSMADLVTIIKHYKDLQQKYGMESMTMQEIYRYINASKLTWQNSSV